MMRSFLILCIICGTVFAMAQSTVTVSEEVQLQSDRFDDRFNEDPLIEYVSSAADNVSGLEKMEFRTDTDEWNLDRQRYTFRTSLKGRGEVKAERSWLTSHLPLLEAERSKQKADHMRSTYRDILEVYKLQQQSDLVLERLVVERDRYRMHSIKATEGLETDILAIIKAESRISLLELRLQQLEERVTVLTSQLLGRQSSGLRMVWDGMPVKDLISAELAATRTTITNQDIAIKEREVDQRMLALSKEKAESEKILDFVQIEYTGQERSGLGNSLSFGLGVILPTGTVNRSNIVEASIDLLKEKEELEQEEWELAEEIDALRISFAAKAKEYLDTETMVKSLKLDQRLTALAEQEGVSPEDLLGIKLLMLQHQENLLDLSIDLYGDYLRLSYLKGELTGPSVTQIFKFKN